MLAFLTPVCYRSGMAEPATSEVTDNVSDNVCDNCGQPVALFASDEPRWAGIVGTWIHVGGLFSCRGVRGNALAQVNGRARAS